MYPKAFTVAEANQLIPMLESVLDRIGRQMEDVQAAAEKLQVLDVLWGDRLLSAGNPDHGEAEALRATMTESMETIRDLVEREIHGRGLRFPPGGLEHGLIDFPTTHDGRWVFLCWRSGEESVSAWHEVDAGFAGRQRIRPEHGRTMGSGPADAS